MILFDCHVKNLAKETLLKRSIYFLPANMMTLQFSLKKVLQLDISRQSQNIHDIIRIKEKCRNDKIPLEM